MLQKLYLSNNDTEVISSIIDTLNDGGIVAYPTDTTYALGCNCLKERAVERICKLKGIDPNKHYLSIVCEDLSNIAQYAKVDNNTFKLLKRNLPGPFTFILNPSRTLPRIFRNRKQVGIRVPDHPIAQLLCHSLEIPLLSTTIPVEEGDEPEYLSDPELIYERWGNDIDIVIDGGYCSAEPSTIVDCTTGEEPVIVRQGRGTLVL